MIDYITAKFPCRHDWKSIHHFKRNYRVARLRHCGTTVEVKSIKNGNFLVVSGNPAKLFQGHNVFGSNDLQGICRDLFSLVTEKFNIKVEQVDQQAINEGYYSLSRVDLAVNFRLPSNEVVSKTIREMEWNWREIGRNVSNYGDETVYQNQHSKVASTKLYNKRKELHAHPLPEHILGRDACDRLRRYTERLLRAEFVLRSTALKKLKLNIGSGWNITKVRSLIKKNVLSLAIERDVNHLILPIDYCDWKPEFKQTYRLWLQGNDLRILFEEKTLQRRRKSLLEFGIDIRHPPVPERIAIVSISSLLTLENITHIPRFAESHGLVHRPSRI